MNTLNAEQDYWYVLYTYPNYEKKVYSSLLKNAITAFLPLQKIKRQWSDRTKVVEVPLFPNYLFIKTDEKSRFRILDTFGVKQYISFEGRPAMISEVDIQSIRKITDYSGLNIEQSLVQGDRVKVIDGPFKDMVGILFQKTGQTRFGIRIESINQTISVNIPRSLIKRI